MYIESVIYRDFWGEMEFEIGSTTSMEFFFFGPRGSLDVDTSVFILLRFSVFWTVLNDACWTGETLIWKCTL